MKIEPCTEFESDKYIERLILTRRIDPVRFLILPERVRAVVEEYEREKELAEKNAR